MFEGKNVLLCVTGSISVYKAVDLASKLVQDGATVDVIMTESATKFVTPLSFQSITHRPVHTDMWAPVAEFNIKHVALAERADVIAIAPATANTIAKIARGIADDLLSCTVLSTKASVIVAPAMDVGMYQNSATQENVKRIRNRGFKVVGPAIGHLASGLEGPGRLAEVPAIQAAIYQVLGQNGDLAGKRIVVSAGGTQEPIDPVRYIGNYSSGKMGFAIAEAARNRGAFVTLIAASTSVPPPLGVELVPVQTAMQMREAVLELSRTASALIMAAAVADYRPQNSAPNKIKRKQKDLKLELSKTPDIVAEVSGSVIKVGFAAESQDLLQNATGKLKEKGLDLIVGNDITAPDSGFSVDTNKVIIIDRNGEADQLPLMPKIEVAHKILDRVVALLPRVAH
ncbi:MAG: bifunctional phosphopantothenoylcysteine decarboxylase/phosphopantothenate--cysteine ligase CoaBC [Chloroflexi bacterium]|jgi:phosphopantothenoylcysteine decarboxylase / phosphopantothenate---cysteine ligase|nr:bifunctional phosphopantothenoylcysteine decarboxylase/phosphopantothenate--cysteine ligase CoaBC [Chloroflexota bacterium]